MRIEIVRTIWWVVEDLFGVSCGDKLMRDVYVEGFDDGGSGGYLRILDLG